MSDIAYGLAEHLNLDPSLIEPKTTQEMQEKTPRPQYSGLSIEKARTIIGYEPVTLKEGIIRMFK